MLKIVLIGLDIQSEQGCEGLAYSMMDMLDKHRAIRIKLR